MRTLRALSSAVERLPYKERVGGSIPSVPTKLLRFIEIGIAPFTEGGYNFGSSAEW
jgi:hypothetical protein